MGIRTGSQFRDSLRDGRTVYINGERVKDVTSYPAFEGVVETLCALYDLQHEHTDLLCYPSPRTDAPVSLSFLMAESVEQVQRRCRAEEFRAEATFGMMGRLPDFCNALVTDSAAARATISERNPRFGENLLRYYEACRDNDWCLTHTLVDPQIDRSKGPGELDDPFLALRLVRETDRGIMVRGARMLSTLAPFANELWVGPFYPRKPGEEPYALCFALPMETPGLKFICRESYDGRRGAFDRPLSSRFDEGDALAVFDDVLVPWERVFINGDIDACNYLLQNAPGYAALQGVIRGTVKMKFLTGLACYLAETIGRSELLHVQAQLGELVAYTEMLGGLIANAAAEVAAARQDRSTSRSLAAVLFVFMPEVQVRAVEVIRRLSGSGLIMTPTERDFASTEIAAYVEKYLRGKDVPARRRVQLFKLAWDLIGEAFGGRQLQYEWFYAGDPMLNRARFYRSHSVAKYKAMVDKLLSGTDGGGRDRG
jgi:4-hydroxyphenylacetate 3-monooxygenase/anthranilate 3-monooxygenase (FAD)/4-hydroxyphenylacetate 3-monooxygenase